MRRLTALSLLPLFLLIANLIEAFIILTGWSLRRVRSSLISSNYSTDKAPAAS